MSLQGGLISGLTGGLKDGLGGSTGTGGGAIPYIPSLDFSDARNSGLFALIFVGI